MTIQRTSREKTGSNKGRPHKLNKKVEGTPREKTKAIWELRHEFKIAILLLVAKIPRSTYYYHISRLKKPDKYEAVKSDILRIFRDENKCRRGVDIYQ